MSDQANGAAVQKLPTGIASFDVIAKGGLPKNRTTLLSGTAGSGKTVFAVQFLAAGIQNADEHGVFVTFEESAADIRENMRSFGWDLERWEREGRLAFVDASPDPHVETIESGSFDLGALLARVDNAVRKVGAKRVSVDSLGAVFSQFSDQSIVRRELFRIASALKAMNVTAVLTAERTDDYGPIARFGVEEFIADNVMVLRNVLEEEIRRRTIEILKFRGTDHQKGENPFTIIPNGGLMVIPLSAIQLRQKSSDVRITSGSADLDTMCGGGFFRDSVILVSGATGTGKTLTVTQFLNGGAATGERCLLLAFEESREQLFRNANGWGVDFERLERENLLRVVCDYPEVAGLEDWLISIQGIVEEFKPGRVALDSLSALERVGTMKAFREFVIGFTSAHLDAHRLDHPPAICGNVRRDEARHHGAQDAWLDSRQAHPRVHDRPVRDAPRAAVPQRDRHPGRRAGPCVAVRPRAHLEPLRFGEGPAPWHDGARGWRPGSCRGSADIELSHTASGMRFALGDEQPCPHGSDGTLNARARGADQ